MRYTRWTEGRINSISAVLVIFLEILFSRFIFHWGNGLAPLYIPAMVTVLYALWSGNSRLSFLVGFFSLIAMFSGPLLFYMEVPPVSFIVPMLGWGIVFGFLGLGAAEFRKRFIN